MKKKLTIEEALLNTQKKRKRRKPAVIAIFVLIFCSLPLLRLASNEKDLISESESVKELKEHVEKALIYGGSAFFLVTMLPCWMSLFLPSKEEEALADFIASSTTKTEPDDGING